MNMFFIGAAILLLGGPAAGMFDKNLKTKVLSVMTVIGSALCLIPALKTLFGGDTLIKTLNFNTIFGPVNFVIDPLAAFFILIITVMSSLSVIYANGYLEPYKDAKNINSHLLFLPMLIASMLAVVTCQNAFLFLICWEVMSLSSFFLVIFENNKKDVLKAGIKYLVFMHVSVILIILAFAIVSLKSGSFDFSSFKSVLGENASFANLVFILAFIGFVTKAGFVPFHNWLPDGHPAAPTHVSAIMSGVMIKTGIYGILRMLGLIGTPSKLIAYIVLSVASVTALYGILYAITQKDLKRLLAYSSIENIGIIGIGIGVGMLGLAYGVPSVAFVGFCGGILHILNHSIFKELLFLAVGIVYLKTHTRNIEVLGGLIKGMPITAMLFLVGAVAICALPPFNGFVSEFFIYYGLFKGLSIHHFGTMVLLLFVISGLALVGTMAILCFSKVFGIAFLGMPRSEAAEKVTTEAPKVMVAPLCVLALFALLIGIYPQHVCWKLICKAVCTVIPTTSVNIWSACYEPMKFLPVLALYAVGLFSFIAVMIILKLKFTKGKIVMHETWGCGYDKGNNKMQYTASSYVSPFLSMLKPLFKKVFDIEKPKKLFPTSAHFSLNIEDIEEAYVINPMLKLDEWFLSKFETIQSGNIQSYIKYGLIFLMMLIIGSLFIG